MAERERQEREEADNKIKRARMQNQQLINQKKVEPAAPDTNRIHKDAIIRVDEKSPKPNKTTRNMPPGVSESADAAAVA